MRDSRAGDRTRATPTEADFWARITGCDVTGLRYTFLRVYPEASTDRADFAIGKDLAYRFTSDAPEEGYARESNGNRGVPTLSVVRDHFIGYDADDLPADLVSYGDARPGQGLPPHDHRSNNPMDGGFAFSVFHPGTSLPQQRFGV
jgi:hypothetical protein